MPRLRRNEWNFASNAAALISALLAEPIMLTSAMGHAEAELSELRGARRLDLVIFSRLLSDEPLITGELKVPWDPQGRTPYNWRVVEDAFSKAANAGAQYFITWNIRRLVVWKTDQPGVQLADRVVFDLEVVPQDIKSAADFAREDVQTSLRSGVTRLLAFMNSTFAGLQETRFLPVDLIFIARLESALDHPIFAATEMLSEQIVVSRSFRSQLDGWMRDTQGWVVGLGNESENLTRASRFTCYVLVNKLCFYNALRRKYQTLPRLVVSNSVKTGAALERRLGSAFNDARRYTGDYESVFDGDFGDTLPFLADSAVLDWRELIRMLDSYDFASIDVDVIGAMYERLITPSERHRYGQHYTQPSVVALMSALTIEQGTDSILDPGCGGGTFLVGAYSRKHRLDAALEHSELLADLYGCDILQYACHLTTVNLAIRDLIDDDNFPRVHRGDFLAYRPEDVFSVQPVRMQAGGLPTGVIESRIAPGSIDVVIGNPPYINSRELSDESKSTYLRNAQLAWPRYAWKRTSDIYIYFFLHAALFLRDGGRLVLLTQSGWMDGDFGVPLQEWMLGNFTIDYVIETDAEPWFTDARVATAITVLRKRESMPTSHEVRFIQFNKSLAEIYADTTIGGAEGLAEALKRGLPDFPFLRSRNIPQSALLLEGMSGDEIYAGSRWGRHLRSPDSIYYLSRTQETYFTRLSNLTEIRRGITTNCDDFFLVEDATAESLVRADAPNVFRELFGVSRNRVVDLSVKIVRRSDGGVFALPAENLVPILKTARDFKALRTSGLEIGTLAVVLPSSRSLLSALCLRYVEAGERERWHLSPSFVSNRSAWFTLREQSVSPILFPKTSQYSPLVLLNDGDFLANQRLYEMKPKAEVSTMPLWAMLNSSLFAFERYTAAKSLGREAAIDIEVFTANSLRIPDLRSMPASILGRLSSAALLLQRESPTPALDDHLMSNGQLSSREYLARTPSGPVNWPSFFKSFAREMIDLALLEGVGIAPADAPAVRVRLCNDLLTYTRRLKMLEFQAQSNRRGAGGARVSARELAADLLHQLVSGEQLTLRRIPNSFIPQGADQREFHIPVAGRLLLRPPDLFTGEVRGRLGVHELSFAHAAEAALIALLARNGLAGSYMVPTDMAVCAETLDAINDYLSEFRQELEHASASVSTDAGLQTRIQREGMGLLLHTTSDGADLSSII